MEFPDIPKFQKWQVLTFPIFGEGKNKIYMVEIERLLRVYPGGAPNTNAHRTTLLELRIAIEQARDDLSRISDKVQRSNKLEVMHALDRVAKKKLKEARGPKKYDDVVCIGYTQLVAGGGKNYWGEDDNAADLIARWDIMKEAITIATDAYKAEGVPPDVDEKRLKIFMAPEFYFRGKRGGYNMDQLFDLVGMVRQVTALHPHWLFVLGTLIVVTQTTEVTGADKVATTAEQRRGEALVPAPVGWKEKETGMILENYAVIQKGGYAAADGMHDHQVAKENVSQLDFDYRMTNVGEDMRVVKLRPDMPTPSGGKDLPGGVTNRPEYHTTKSPEKTANTQEHSAFGCVFNMDEITFGLEVCLDHLEGRLFQAPDKGGVKIHLIPSAGMDIKDDKSSASTIRFNVDGLRKWRRAGSQDKRNPCLLAPLGTVECWFDRPVPAGGTYFPADGHIQAFKPLPIP